MNTLKQEKKLAVLSGLVEGNSLRSTCRMTGVHRTTIMRLLNEAGEKCMRLLDAKMQGLSCQAIEVDEVWTYVKKKERRLTPEERMNGSGVEITRISGNPTRSRICTSYVERNNLTMRLALKRLNRLTLAFSKKLENLKAAIALHFAYYNFCRIHGSLRITPAMAAGISDHVWSLEEILSC